MGVSPLVVRQPAEWDSHSAVWTAWPSHPAYWEGHIEAARHDVAGFVKALSTSVPDAAAPEGVHLWVDGEEAERTARLAIDDDSVVYHREEFGDIWFRDIAPVFVESSKGTLEYRTFGYNGWGEKFRMPGDETVAARIGSMTGLDGEAVPMVFEGGALDVDGTGLGLTTRSCLLNPNRNPELSQEQIERHLEQHLGVDSLIWLDDGLLNDHTDGHIDNIARFVAPGVVVCQYPWGDDDPNRDVLIKIASDLHAWRSPDGRFLDVVKIPSPGRVTADSGEILPASHTNFYIANDKVIVPTFGTPGAEEAVSSLQTLFPRRKVIGLPAKGILMGGGTFHCITQQQPAL